jgi:hypothetical protein
MSSSPACGRKTRSSEGGKTVVSRSKADDPFDARIGVIIEALRRAQKEVFEPHVRAIRAEREAVMRELREVKMDSLEDAPDRDIVESGLRFRLDRIAEAEARIDSTLRKMSRKLDLIDEPALEA